MVAEDLDRDVYKNKLASSVTGMSQNHSRRVTHLILNIRGNGIKDFPVAGLKPPAHKWKSEICPRRRPSPEPY